MDGNVNTIHKNDTLKMQFRTFYRGNLKNNLCIQLKKRNLC